MRRVFIAIFALTLLTTTAQPMRAEDSLESQLSARLGKVSSRSSTEARPNELVKGSVAYSGIVVQVLKTDNLFQLLNPLAPAKYGSAENNTLRDSVTGRVSGWKLFSIRF
jgi:hypothetical protein